MRLGALILAAAFVMIPVQPGSAGNCTRSIGRNAAAFSPDGSTLAVIVDEGACPRWRVGISWRGGQVTWLDTPGPDESAAGLSWSPNGRHFVTGFVSPANAVAVYDAQATSGRQLRTIARGVSPAWSPDGRSIAFVDTRYEIHVVAPDGTGDRRVAAGDRPAWSADSTRLAYVRQGSIYVAAADGSGERRLASGERASWSPDGAWIGVLREGSAYLVRPDGSEERRIGAGEPIQWSPSGDEVALLDSAGVLRRVSLSTGQTSRVAEDVSAAAVSPEWHPLATLVATVLRVGRRSEVYVSEGTGAIPARRTAPQCDLYTARCVHGTDRADRVVGTAARDVVFPGAGDDRVSSGGGDDRIDTTYGRDFVDAGPSNDIVYTQGNDDVLLGRAGRDFLIAGNGEDIVDGGPGRDWIVVAGDGRVDRVRCGAGKDFVDADPPDKVARDCERVRLPPT
jgi:RTX calcium-binding nonapeptide repeat (4 copies)/WD40-like Beta Propeller Repeat